MKEIRLTKGYKAIVDDEDFSRLARFKWQVHITGHGNIYATRHNVAMHRIIMNAPRGKLVDHINGNGLDNRRANLRICTNAENMRNRHAQRNSTSGYRGVTWDKERKLWTAAIVINNRHITIGRFPDKESAARAYDKKAKEVWGEFYSTHNIST